MRLILLMALLAPGIGGADHFGTSLSKTAFRKPPIGADYFFSFLETVPTALECAGSPLVSEQGQGITFDRNGGRYCTKSDGTLVWMDADEPAIEATGLSIEGTATNLAVRSAELCNTTSAWTHDAVTCSSNAIAAPDGTLTAETVTTTAASGQHRIFSNATVLTGASVASVYAKAGTAPWLRLYVASTITAYCDINVSTGTMTFANTGAECRVEALANGWHRIAMQYTGDGSSSQRVILKFADTQANTAAGQAWANGTLTMHFWGADLKNQGVLTSYIPTNANSADRVADVASFAPTESISAAGCAKATVALKYFGAGRVVGFAAAEAALRVATATTASVHDGTNTVTQTTVASMQSRTTVLRSYWSGSAMNVAIDGSEGTANTFDGNMNAGTVYLGSQAGTSNFLNGNLKSVRLGNGIGCR